MEIREGIGTALSYFSVARAEVTMEKIMENTQLSYRTKVALVYVCFVMCTFVILRRGNQQNKL